jgi:hypothetical protein
MASGTPRPSRASGEFEYVGRKPLGDRFTAVPVRDIRGSLTRSFRGELFEAGVHFLLANGYTGQTLETSSCRTKQYQRSGSWACETDPMPESALSTT